MTPRAATSHFPQCPALLHGAGGGWRPDLAAHVSGTLDGEWLGGPDHAAERRGRDGGFTSLSRERTGAELGADQMFESYLLNPGRERPARVGFAG